MKAIRLYITNYNEQAKMFNKCKECFGKLNELDILEEVETCKNHDQPCKYICLQEQEQCMENPLLCVKCLEEHRDHKWESLEKYFNPTLRRSLKTGTSVNGVEVQEMAGSIFNEISKMRTKISTKIDDLYIRMTQTVEQLKTMYPVQNRFGISGTKLSTQNVHEFVAICEREKQSQWIGCATQFLMKLFREVTRMICNLFDDFHTHIANRNYPIFTQFLNDQLITTFMKKYQGVFSEDPHYFKFSTELKHFNIRIKEGGREARFMKQSPSKPAAVLGNVMTPRHPTVYFLIKKLEKTALIFDKQLIVVGVCLPKTVKSYGYRAIVEPSHGGFAIGSSGKTYHSKLYKYEKVEQTFSFGTGDIIGITLDYNEKRIIFFKKAAFFRERFEMELGLEDDQIAELKPCVMFDGEPGAVVRVLEEYEAEPTSRKNATQPQYEHQLT